MIGSELLRYQNDQKYLLIDTETEGLNLFASRPWQIAYTICTNKEIGKVNIRYPLWEDLKVSDEAARITRFNKQNYLSLAEKPEDILKDFEQLLLDPSYTIIGHNLLGFDIYILETLRRLTGRVTDWSYLPRIVDTLCLSRAYRHNIVPDLKNFTAWQYKMLTMRMKGKGFGASLGAMAREFKIDYNERLAHDAEYDCSINHQVFQKLLWAVEV